MQNTKANTLELPDIQKTRDTRGIAIPRVGVTRVTLPVRLRRKPIPTKQTDLDSILDGECTRLGVEELKHEHCESVGVFEASVTLPAEVKGTHMSRFSEIIMSTINENQHLISVEDLYNIAVLMKMTFEAERVDISMSAAYFVEQKAPVSGRLGMAPMDIFLSVCIAPEGEFITTGCGIAGMTTCPCSREISDFNTVTQTGKGAHSQRGEVNVSLVHKSNKMIWFEDLFEVVTSCFSSPVFPVLKRPDEREVTINSYSNPKFVEDVVRDVAQALNEKVVDDLVLEYNVRVTNAESIHYHDAFAEVNYYVQPSINN